MPNFKMWPGPVGSYCSILTMNIDFLLQNFTTFSQKYGTCISSLGRADYMSHEVVNVNVARVQYLVWEGRNFYSYCSEEATDSTLPQKPGTEPATCFNKVRRNCW